MSASQGKKKNRLLTLLLPVCGACGIARARRFAAALGLCWLSASSAAHAQSGWVLQYMGRPCDGIFCQFWQELDRNGFTARIAIAGGHLYQLQPNGLIWKSPETPCTSRCPGWQYIEYDPTTKAIFSDGASLYKVVQDGRLLRRTGDDWEMVAYEAQGGPVVAAAFGGGTTAVVQTGRLSLRRSREHTELNYVVSVGLGITYGPHPVAVTGSSGVVYELRPGWIRSCAEALTCPELIPGYINEYSVIPALDPPYWQFTRKKIDPPHNDTVAISAGSDSLFTLQNDGSIWRYQGGMWDQIDNNPNVAKIVASGDKVYKLHIDGSLWRAVCNGALCGGWELLLAGGGGRIAVDGEQVYVLTQAQPLARLPIWLPDDGRPFPLQYVCSECL